MKKTWYLYFHINKITKEVFYVGIGNMRRPYNKHKRSSWWKKIVNKYGYIIEIKKVNLTFELACRLEKYCIKKIGRRDLGLGTLVNLTDGGEGTSFFSPINKKKVIDSKGNIYNSITEASIVYNLKRNNLRDMLKNKFNNTTDLMFLNPKDRTKKIAPPPKQSKIINSEGIIFNSLIEASEVYKIKRVTLSAMLCGRNRNKTDLKYLDESKNKQYLKEDTTRKKLINNKGEIFESITYAAKEYNINRRTLSGMLLGESENTTDLRYYGK